MSTSSTISAGSSRHGSRTSAEAVRAGQKASLPLNDPVLKTAVDLLLRLVESGGAIVIFLGAVLALVRFVYFGVPFCSSLLAAGLLRLSAHSLGYGPRLTAAVIIGVRKITVAGYVRDVGVDPGRRAPIRTVF